VIIEQQVSVEELQRKLSEHITSLDKQRKEESERFDKELSERTQLAETERRKQLAEYQEQERKRDERRKAEEELVAQRAREEREARIALETSLAAAEEARKKQEEKLKWLVDEINRQEFIEEQHQKSLATFLSSNEFTTSNPTEVNVEHPVAPLNAEHPVAPLNAEHPGEAVQGTTGATPDTPLMSDHLKQILRQAQRS
jgi:hypothetical protein